MTPEEAVSLLIERRQAREHFAGFCEYTALPGEPLAAHHRLIAEALESVAKGETDRLMLEMPPGSAKSTFGSVKFPAYFMSKNPTLSTILAGNTTLLAEKFGRRVRNQMADPRIYNLFGTRLAEDSQSAGRWATSDGGEFLAAGVGAAITGNRSDLGIIDDPVKSREEADSKLIRDKQWDWYLNDFRTRLKPGARQVVIMTRWHEDDLSGRILEHEPGRWKRITLPMEAMKDDPLGRKVGERLWPEWFTEQMVLDAKADPRSWSSLYQQQPRPKEGAEFKRTWVQRYGRAPKTNNLILVDAASGQKADRGDFTCMWVIGLGADGNAYELDVIRGRWNITERVDKLFDLHRKWKPLAVRYERYGMMADVQQIRAEQEKRGYRFKIVEVAGALEKNARIRRLIPWFENGRLYLSAGHPYMDERGNVRDVLQDFLEEEYSAFPVGKHDDMLDALSRLCEPDLTLPWPKPEESTGMEDLVAEWGVLDSTVGY